MRSALLAVAMLDLGFLLFGTVLLAGLASEESGIRFLLPRLEATIGARPAGTPIYLKILPDGSLLVDGETVALAQVVDRLRPRIAAVPERAVVLYCSDEAPYGALVAVVDRIAASPADGGLELKRLEIPTHDELPSLLRLLGNDSTDRARGGM